MISYILTIITFIIGTVVGVAATLYMILKNPIMILERIDIENAMDFLEYVEEEGEEKKQGENSKEETTGEMLEVFEDMEMEKMMEEIEYGEEENKEET